MAKNKLLPLLTEVLALGAHSYIFHFHQKKDHDDIKVRKCPRIEKDMRYGSILKTVLAL